MALTLEIVTPEAKVFSAAIDTVVIPTVDGEIGVLPGHIPLLTQVSSGQLVVTREGKTEALIVGDGFAQVQGDVVSVLTEHALEEAKIDENAIETAMQRAQESLKTGGSDMDPAEIERLESVVRFSVAALTVRKKR
ncbi:MAG: ATP synthase F1 subunit epsilon [Opitutaceae bacterium]|nr:ATP synthase F1 subunit epsilon [Opitutaceae bacterium]